MFDVSLLVRFHSYFAFITFLFFEFYLLEWVDRYSKLQLLFQRLHLPKCSRIYIIERAFLECLKFWRNLENHLRNATIQWFSAKSHSKTKQITKPIIFSNLFFKSEKTPNKIHYFPSIIRPLFHMLSDNQIKIKKIILISFECLIDMTVLQAFVPYTQGVIWYINLCHVQLT